MRGPRGLPPHPRRRSSRRGRRFCATCVRGLHLRRLLGEGVKQMFHVKHTPTGYHPLPAVSRPSGSTGRPPLRTGPTARAGSTARTGPAARTGPTARAGPAPPPGGSCGPRAFPGGSCRVLVGRPPVFWAALQIQSVLHPAFTAVHAFSCGQQGKGQVANASQAFAEAQPLCGECKTVRICSAAAFFSRFCPALAASHAG